MKKVVNVGIGGKGFILEVEAYNKLSNYLEQFRSKLSMANEQTNDVMDDLEARIAEIFSERLAGFKDVVDINLVDMVICQLGMPDGSQFEYNPGTSSGAGDAGAAGGAGVSGSADQGYDYYAQNGIKKFYRDEDHKSIGGVCSGLAIYLGLDIALVRILFVICFFMVTASFWIYIILWIVAPLAVTPAQKCEQHGLPLTPENLNRFSGAK